MVRHGKKKKQWSGTLEGKVVMNTFAQGTGSEHTAAYLIVDKDKLDNPESYEDRC